MNHEEFFVGLDAEFMLCVMFKKRGVMLWYYDSVSIETWVALFAGCSVKQD
jgi:hypothetical protein